MIFIFSVPVLLFLLGMILYSRLPSYSLEEIKEGANSNDPRYLEKFEEYKGRMNGVFFFAFVIVMAIGILPIFFQSQIFSLFQKINSIHGLVVAKDFAVGGYGIFLFMMIALFPFVGKLLSRAVSRELDLFVTLYAKDPLEMSDAKYVASETLKRTYLPVWFRIFKSKEPLSQKRDETFSEKIKIFNMEKVAALSFKKQLFFTSLIVLVGGLLSIGFFNNYVVFTDDYVGESVPWSTQMKRISWNDIEYLDLIHYEKVRKGRHYIEYNYAIYKKDGSMVLENTWPALAPNSISAQDYLKIREVMLARGVPVREQ